MKNIKRILAITLSICLICSWTGVALAADSGMLPLNAENITRMSDGSYVYKVDNKYYYYDIEQNESLLLIERIKCDNSSRQVIITHVPRDLRPDWIFWQTDGAYQVSINMNTVNRILQTTGSWMEVSVAIGLAVGALMWAYEAANGNFNTNQVLYEIDDGYYDSSDFGHLRVESYYYSSLELTHLIDQETFIYYSYW